MYSHIDKYENWVLQHNGVLVIIWYIFVHFFFPYLYMCTSLYNNICALNYMVLFFFFFVFSVIGSPSNSACAVRTENWKRTAPDCCRRSASSSIRCRTNQCWRSSTPRWPVNKRIRSPSISPRISWPRVSTMSKTNSCEDLFIIILYRRGSKYKKIKIKMYLYFRTLCRKFAKTIPKKFGIRYNPYTQNVQVLESKLQLQELANNISNELQILRYTLNKMDWRIWVPLPNNTAHLDRLPELYYIVYFFVYNVTYCTQ